MNNAQHNVALNDSAADLSPSLRLAPQQRLGWLAQLPGPILRLQVGGPLDLAQLQQWLNHWVAQHEALRLQLQAVPGLQVPLQQVLPVSAAASLVRVENSEQTPDAPIAGIVLHWQRIAGAQDQAQRHRLQLRLAAHGADRGTLLQLAQALMGAFHSGKLTDSAEQNDDAMSYSQYSGWLYDLQEDEDAASGHQFWQQHSAGEGSLTESSLVYRQLAPSSEYCSLNNAGALATQRLELSAPCWQAVEELSERSGYRVEEILMAAWAVTLQRLSHDGENARLLLNWQHDCRADYEELAPCWGLFSKSLPLPWHSALDQDFHQALARLRGKREAASEWQEYQAIEHNPGAAQLRYGFEWGGDWSPIDRTMATATHCQIHSLNALSAPCELLLIPHIETLGDTTSCVLELTYLAPCYPEPTAQAVLEQYHSLLNAACQDSNRPLAQLPMNSAHFQQTLAKLRQQSGDLGTEHSSELSSSQLFPAQFSAVAARYSDLIALVDASSETDPAAPHSGISYAELERRSNQLAQRLIQQGAGAETRVALYLERSATMIVAMLGVLKAGAAFLPLEPQQPAARQLAILQQAACPLLLSLSGLQTPELPGLQRINLDDPSLAEEATTPPQLTIAADAAAYVLFTSGSTGSPKGVVVEHAQLHHYSHSILKRLALQAGESSALVTSLAADLSYTLLFPTLLSGGCLHILAREQVMNSGLWAAYQQQHAIDHIKMVPALLDAWLNHEPAQQVLPGRTLLLGGESFPASLLNRIRQLAPQLRVFNHYGPTETTVGVLIHPCLPGTSEQFRPVPLSQRLDHCVIEILDAQQQPVAPGQVGELVISGAQVARGYLHQLEPRDAEEANEPSRRASGFGSTTPTTEPRAYRSGDLARYLPDGSIEIIGRADRQVKIRGFRVELDEIEQQLSRLPGVRQAAVEARPGPAGALQLFAFITQQPQPAMSLSQRYAQLQERLPDYMLPTLRLVDQLPLMANGKLDRNTLRNWAEQLQQHRCTTPPRNPLEALLVQHWAAVLGLETVGIEDDFFQLGGHSLAAVKLASRLQQALKQPVSVNAVFSAPSVLRFAQQLQQNNASALRRLSAAAATPAQALPNLFCFHPSTGLVHDYQPLADALPDWSVWGVQSIQLGEALIREEGTGALQNQASAPNLQQLAQDYVTQIRQQQAQGPYHLLGWSLGGLLAASAAQILEQEGAQVAFLGIVDSQWPGHESGAGKTRDSELSQQVDGLLAQAVSELDAASQQRLQQLPASRREQLIQELTALPAHQRLRHLALWAQQAGLHLAQGSWEQLLFNLDSHPHTQALLASFQPPRLNCAIHAWWAETSLNHADFTPLDCAALSQQPLTRQVIPAQHLNILRHPQWQQQISQALAACRLQPETTARKQEPA